MSIDHLLNRELTVWRPSTDTDDVGGQTLTWAEIGPVPVMVSQPRADERTVAGQAGAQLSHVVHTRSTADVARGDELAGDLPSDIPEGHRLRVLAVVSDSRGTYRRLATEAVQAEPGG